MKKSKSIKDAGTMRLKTLHKAGVKDMSHMFSNMPKVEEHHLVAADEAQLQILELLQHKHPKIRALAEDQLTHLYKEDGEVKVKDGGFLPIAEMLKYKDIDVQSGALWSCSALAASSEDNHDGLISDIGWELLKSRARGAGDIKEAAVSTIANLCINEAMHDMVMNEGGIQLIKNAAGDDDSILLKRAAANAFANLTASPENIPAVLADGGFEKILNFLRSGDDELVAAALHILANILPHDPYYKEQLINGGYVPEIVDLMNSNNSLIRNGATAVIRQLLGDHNTHNHLLGMGVLDTLCKLSRRPEPQLQFLVAASLNELAGNAEIRAQVKEVATNPLKQLARSRDPEVKKEAIEALNKLGIRVLSKAEKEEKERLEKEAAAREKAEREAAERAAREKAEREAREAREAAERAAREKAEREAAERASREKAEREAREAREASDRKAREDADRRAREEADRRAREDADRRAREDAERRAREEAERRAREEAERRAREEAERRAREEADRLRRAKEDAERRAREEAERRAREEAERRAREEADRLAREQAERDLAALAIDKDEEWRRTLLEEMNFARTQPQDYAKELEKLRSQYEGNDFYLTPQRIIETDEGIAALEDAISFFKRQRPLPPFERCSMGMCKSCEDLCNELGPSGRARGGDSSERWERYGKWSGRMVEIIGYRIDDPKTAVQQWMIDDGDPDRINRKHILDTQFQVVGFAHSFHATRKTICVVQFATSFSEDQNANHNAPRAVQSVDHNADPNATHIVIVSEQLDVSSAGILRLHARGRQLLLTTTVKEEVVGNTVKSININNRWQLPVNFNPNEVEARFQNKKLTIRVPKQPRGQLVNRSINDSIPVQIL